MTFSDSDATRIIAALETRAERKYKDGAQTSHTWGTVSAVDTYNKVAAVLLYGESDSAYQSEGFRIPETMYLTIGDKVKTAINYQTGERWIEENNAPATAHKKIAIDLDNGTILTGDGSVAPTPVVFPADTSGVNFLVGTATGLLSAEIAVGTTPGGELGGTWASPTVDATHSGSTHAATQAAAEATASGALSTHAAAADPHTGYQKESEKDAANGYVGLDASSHINLGDTNLYRSASNVLKTDDALTVAGVLTASKVMTAAPARFNLSGNLTLGTSAADISGCTTTFTPTEDETVLVITNFEFFASTPGSTSCYGTVVVDGSAQTPMARLRGNADVAASVASTAVFTLTANTSHTVKLQAYKSAAVGVMTAEGTTGFTILRFKT